MDGVRADAEHVAWPGLLRADRGDGSFSLHNPGHGTSIDVEEESAELVELILEGFAEPRTLADFCGAYEDVPEGLLVLMVRSGLVVEVSELAFLEHGFLRPPSMPVGVAWSWSELPELAVPGVWVVLGVPVDAHALGMGGARQGPSEIRRLVSGALLFGEGDVVDWEFGRRYPELRPAVADLGDVDPEGSRMDHVGSRLQKVVRELLLLGLKPLVLGGDHSITHYVLHEAIASVPRFGIIHFDAHPDLLPSRTLSHANVFREAIESPRVEHIVQIGLRVVERMTPYASRTPCEKRTVVSAREAARGRALEVLEALPRDLPYYLSFDIDCIDGALARETGTPALGGLSFELASQLVDYAARTFDLLGVDFVEVSGPQAALNGAASVAAALLQRTLMGESSFETLTSDVYVLP
jgi:arginase family enzyme